MVYRRLGGLGMLSMVQQAKEQWEVAQNRFNWATGEDVEVAVLQLLSAEAMYNRAIKLAKGEGIRNEM